MIDIVITNYGRWNITLLTIHALILSNKNIRIFVVNNYSKEKQNIKLPREYRNIVKVINLDTNRGQAGGLNVGLERVKSDYIVLMHNDVIIVDSDWIVRGIKFLKEHKEVGLISAVGWVKAIKGEIVTSLDSIIKIRPAARMNKAFIKVEKADTLVNICRNLGLRADERFGLMGTNWFLEYLNLGYELYTMRFKYGMHIKSTWAKTDPEAYKKQKKLTGSITLRKIREYNLTEGYNL